MLPASLLRATAPQAASLLHPEQPGSVQSPGEPGLGQLPVGPELVPAPEPLEPWRLVVEPLPGLLLGLLGLCELVAEPLLRLLLGLLELCKLVVEPLLRLALGLLGLEQLVLVLRPRLDLGLLALCKLVTVLQPVPGSALDLEAAGDWSGHMAAEAERADTAVVDIDIAVGAEVADTVADTEPEVVHKATEAAGTETEVVAAQNLQVNSAVDLAAASPSPSDTPRSPAAPPL